MAILRPVAKPQKTAKNVKGADSPWSALALNLIMPGLGHALWREYMFGVFVFLVCILAVIIAVISYFLPLSDIALIVLLGLPIVFYLFTFFDLHRTIIRLKARGSIPRNRLVVFLIVGLIYLTLSPTSPGNFLLRNRPELFRIQDNSLSPLLARGDLAMNTNLDYTVNVAFVDSPFFHSLPSRFDIVRYSDNSGKLRLGLVVGLPNEEIAFVSGQLYSNRTPLVEDLSPVPIMGDWPLTYAGGMSILIAEITLGTIQDVVEIPLQQVTGKVSKVF